MHSTPAFQAPRPVGRSARDRAGHGTSGWHHHDVNESSLYVVSGVLRLEFEGHDGYVEAGPGDFVHVPAYTVHRESNPGREPSVVVIARAGDGIPTVNVEPHPHRTTAEGRPAEPSVVVYRPR